MDKELIDQLWQKAMRESIEHGEQFTRYRFALMVFELGVKHGPDYKHGYADGAFEEREACAKVCEQTDEEFEGPDQWDWHSKDYAAAIRARGEA